MLFNNCGIQGDQLALIVEGIAKMKDFKALILRLTSLNALSIEKMLPIFEHPVPYHMEELSLIDCKIGATLIEQLMDFMVEKSRIRKFALVNVHHSEKSFNKVCFYL